jgi:hypothetical protein
VSPLVPVIAALIAAAPGDHPKLEAGIQLYRKGDFKGSLPLLLEALDSGTTRQRATARLYIGLIQHRTGNAKDAEGSFKHALDLWSQIRPPRGTPKATVDAFDAVKEKIAPEPQRERRRRSTVREGEIEEHPEVLEPLEGGSGSSSHDWSVSNRWEEEDPVVVTDPVPPPEDEGLPVLGWVAGSAGAAAAIAGTTLAILAAVTGDRALDETDKPRAKELHDAAGVQNKAALASFGAAGVLFGVAALTVTF